MAEAGADEVILVVTPIDERRSASSPMSSRRSDRRRADRLASAAWRAPWMRGRATASWLKTALHTHTSDTDGELPPGAVAAHYGWAGFDVLTITDHWTLTSVPSTDHLLVITGAELAVDPLGRGRYTEILAIGIDELPDDPGGDRAYWERDRQLRLQDVPGPLDGGGRIHHRPGRRRVRRASVLERAHAGGDPRCRRAHRARAVQRAAAERENGRGDSSYLWDLALEAGMSLSAIATDDSHYPLFDIGDAWTMVHAAERSREAVLEALRTHSNLRVQRAGRCTTCAARAPRSRCAAARAVRWALHTRYQEGWAVRADHRGRQEGARILERDDHGAVVRARFQPDVPDLPFVRVVATDADGRSAWTNPV